MHQYGTEECSLCEGPFSREDWRLNKSTCLPNIQKAVFQWKLMSKGQHPPSHLLSIQTDSQYKICKHNLHKLNIIPHPKKRLAPFRGRECAATDLDSIARKHLFSDEKDEALVQKTSSIESIFMVTTCNLVFDFFEFHVLYIKTLILSLMCQRRHPSKQDINTIFPQRLCRIGLFLQYITNPISELCKTGRFFTTKHHFYLEIVRNKTPLEVRHKFHPSIVQNRTFFRYRHQSYHWIVQNRTSFEANPDVIIDTASKQRALVILDCKERV